MAVTLDDLKTANASSLTALKQSLDRLSKLRTQGLSPSQLNLVLAQINSTEADITTAQIIKAHLDAASVVVSPMAVAEEQELNHLAQELDGIIKANTIANASLAFIQDVVDDVEQLQQMSMQHS